MTNLNSDGNILVQNMERTPETFEARGLFLGELIMSEKVFKTHDELILQLAERGIDFSKKNSKSDAKKHLQRTGYYNLINGYKDMFLQTGSKDTFKSGTTVDEIFALYEFDRKLRGVFLEFILTIEVNTKSLIAYEFSQSHGHKNYLLSTNFTDDKKSVKQVVALIAELQRQTANNVNDPAIEHYLTVHGYIPLWVLNNVLTFGSISKFYSLMKQNERQNIAKIFGVSDKEFESFLFYLSKVRNFCAHGNRLYCYRSRNPIADTPIHTSLTIPKTSKDEYSYGKRDLFACLVVLKMMLSGRDFNSLCNTLEDAIDKLSPQLKVLSLDDILNEMGFPKDWKKIKIASKEGRLIK